jgi:hypothetical protein
VEQSKDRKSATVCKRHAMKACRDSGGKAPYILNVDTSWGGGELHALAALSVTKHLIRHSHSLMPCNIVIFTAA